MSRLKNEILAVDMGDCSPFPVSYRHLPTGTDYGGAPEGTVLSINGIAMPWEEWHIVVDRTGLPQRIGYDLRHHRLGYAIRFGIELKGFELEWTMTVLADPAGTLKTVELPQQMLAIDATTGSIWREEWTQKSWDEKLGRGLWTPDLVDKPAKDYAGDPEPLATIYCCSYASGKPCVTVRSSCRYIPLRNRIEKRNGETTYTIGLAPYQFRARKKTLDPLKIQVAFLPDLNGDGRSDACDYQLWVNRQLPQPLPNYRDAIWYKIYCGDPARGVTTTLAQAEEIIERVHRYTDGLPQIAHLVGWQYDGHDSGYPSMDKFNESLGTRDQLWALHKRCKEDLNTTLTYHINLDDSYPKHPGWDPDVIGREPDGELMRWEEFNGEMCYHISHTKDVESGRVFEKLESMMREVPLEGALHIDAFRNMNWSWDRDGFIGPIEELECGVKPIVEWLKNRGIDVTTESADHSAAEWTGIVSGILHVGRPRELVQLWHGKMIYGGRFWPPSIWGYGLGSSINWDVVYGGKSDEWLDYVWWPLLLDGVYLGTLLYHCYLESEMLSAYLDADCARLRFSDGTETFVKRDDSRLLVTRGDVVIADDFDRFIPRGDSIYAYSRDGSDKVWKLPPEFRGKTLEVRTLGDSSEPATTVLAGDEIFLKVSPRVPVKIALRS